MKKSVEIYYVANDGTKFSTEEACTKHEDLVEVVNNIMSDIQPEPKSFDTVEHDEVCLGYVQHYRYSFLKARKRLLSLAEQTIGPFPRIKQAINDEFVHPSWVAREMDCRYPISRAWSRFWSTDSSLREWSQPYHANNPPGLVKIKRIGVLEDRVVIFSGGQTGADQAGWRAAKAVGFKTGGWMPARYKTEDGNRPEMNLVYNAKETEEDAGYRERTIRNFSDSECTILFGNPSSPGGKLVQALFRERSLMVSHDPYEKKLICVPGSNEVKPKTVADLIKGNGFIKINIAGNRESKSPGIGEWVELWLTEMFSIMKEIM